jgi:hypothetical protein
MDSIKSDGFTLSRWSLGGGTVLMFYYAHRKSKDIDIFVPDPQFLGYVNPGLGGRDEEVTTDFKDGTEFVKLFLPEGEIDFVASSALTDNPFEEHEVLGRKILLETPIEIVAKKLWYRGDRATPRDLLDLALVIEHLYSEILAIATCLRRTSRHSLNSAIHAELSCCQCSRQLRRSNSSLASMNAWIGQTTSR